MYFSLICSSSALFIFTAGISSTSSSFSHTFFSCYFFSFFGAGCLLSRFNNLLAHFSFYCGRFMFFYFCWSHRFLFIIFLERILFPIRLRSSSAFFIFSIFVTCHLTRYRTKKYLVIYKNMLF